MNIDEIKQDELDDFLKHYGVKGMRWGVRRAEKKWEKNAKSQYYNIWNASVDKMDAGLGVINNKPKYKNKDFTKPSKLREQYHEEVRVMSQGILNETANKMLGLSPSGKNQVVLSVDSAGALPSMFIGPAIVEHADEDLVKLDLELDTNGYILSIRMQDPTLMQTSLDDVSEYLEHYGIKGMRWGVRTKRTITPSEDAKRFAKSKKKHVSEMDDKELRDFVNRLNMEQQYKKLNPSIGKKGHAAVKGILAVGATASAVLTFHNTPAGQALANTIGKKIRQEKILRPLRNLPSSG